MAAPHVAGVAALILSVNPNLTHTQVRNAIESTCTKLSSYSFASNSSHPNGTWNSEVGHGLVNAYAAVNSLPAISGPSTVCLGGSTFTLDNLPPNTSVSWSVNSALSGAFTVTPVAGNPAEVSVAWTGLKSCDGQLVASIGGTVVATKNIAFCRPYITGTDPLLVCPDGAAFTVQNTHTMSVIVWSYSSNLQMVSSYCNTATFKSTGTGAAWVSASVNGYQTAQFNTTAGMTVPMSVSWNPYMNGTYRASITVPSGTNVWEFNWNAGAGWSVSHFSGTPPYQTVIITPPASYTLPHPVTAYAFNSCGLSQQVISITGSYGNYSAYPNPVSSTLHFETGAESTVSQTGTLQTQTNSVQTQTAKTVAVKCEVQLYNSQTGGLAFKQQVQSFETNFDIDLSSVPNGVYVLRLVRGDEIVQTQNIVVQH